MRVVLDTNVAVSLAHLKAGSLEDQTLRLALHSLVIACISEPVVEEYERVLGSSKLKLDQPLVKESVEQLRKRAVLVHPTTTRRVCPDESDNRFLECAEAANADVLVTGNKKHFPATWKNTRVMNARQFLELFADDARE